MQYSIPEEEENEEEEEKDEIEAAADRAAEEARKACRERLVRLRKQEQTQDYMRDFVKKHPGWGLRRENGVLKYIHPYERESAPAGTHALRSTASALAPSKAKPADPMPPAAASPAKIPPTTTAEFQADIDALARKHALPGLSEDLLPNDLRQKKAPNPQHKKRRSPPDKKRAKQFGRH